MSEWKELKTMLDVVSAVAGDMEIEFLRNGEWHSWEGKNWFCYFTYRARHRNPEELVRVVFSDNGTTRLYIAKEPERKFNDFPNVEWDRHLSQHQVQELLKNPYCMFAKPKITSNNKVKSLCWRHPAGDLVWGGETCNFAMFKRFPAGDIEGEVEE